VVAIEAVARGVNTRPPVGGDGQHSTLCACGGAAKHDEVDQRVRAQAIGAMNREQAASPREQPGTTESGSPSFKWTTSP